MMTEDELKAIEATLVGLRSETPLGGNDSDTALDIGETLVAEVRRLRAISDDALRQVFVAGWDARRRHSGSSTNPLVDAWEDYRATVIRTMK
jgi:hypothetical protein